MTVSRSEVIRPRLILVFTGLVLAAGLALWYAINVWRFDLRVDPSLPKSVSLDGFQSTEPIPGYPALTDLDEQATLAGQPFVVNFFASWCKGCAEEHANLLAFEESNKGRVIGIVHQDSSEEAARYLDENQSPYIGVAVDTESINAKNFGVSVLPETYIVLGDGTLFHRAVGPLTGERLSLFTEKWKLAKIAEFKEE